MQKTSDEMGLSHLKSNSPLAQWLEKFFKSDYGRKIRDNVIEYMVDVAQQ